MVQMRSWQGQAKEISGLIEKITNKPTIETNTDQQTLESDRSFNTLTG